MKNKKIISTVITVLCVIAIIILWRLSFPSGFYSTPEQAVEHEKKVFDSEVIASFHNGLEVMKVVRNYDELVFYDFPTRKTLTGLKYCASMDCRIIIKYDDVSETCPDMNEWKLIQMFLEWDRGMKNVAFTVVKNSESLQTDDDVMRFVYEFNNEEYVLLCKLVDSK